MVYSRSRLTRLMGRTPREHGIPYFPAFLDVVRKRVVVVGGGAVATTKVKALLPCQPAPLIVVAPQASEFIRARRDLEWRQRAYQSGDLDHAELVFAATDDRVLNARVARDARSRGISVLAIDDVPNCDFIAPAIVRRGDVVIAISTGGRTPPPGPGGGGAHARRPPPSAGGAQPARA